MNQFVRRGFSQLRFIKQDREPLIQVSKLSNGIHFLSEQSQFPSQSDIGIAFRVGPGNERPTERGSVSNLKKRLYFTNHDDWLINFESMTKTGAMLDIHQQPEVIYYKCQFVPEDFQNVVQTFFKLALTPKQIFQSEITELTEANPLPFKELLIKSAFKDQQMGNSATEGESYPLTNEEFVKFQLENLTPSNMAIGYSGIIPHEIIKNIIEEKLSGYQEFFNRKLRAIPTYNFTPGTVRDITNDEMINIAIIYEGLKWSDPNIGILQIAQRILGSSSSWSSGGPGKGMRSRTTLNMMNRIHSVQSAEGYYQPFIESGLFGIIVGGSYDDSKNLLIQTLNELKGMIDPMTDEEFMRGKLCLLSSIHLQLERQSDRLEENLINHFTVGKTTDDYDSLITPDYLSEMIRKQSPLVVYSGQINRNLRDHDEIAQYLRQ